MEFKIHPKEKVYFGIMVAISSLLYGLIITGTIMAPPMFGIMAIYLGIFIVFNLLAHTFFIGHLKGNAIKLTENQFPDIYQIVKTQSEQLNFSKIPTIYLLQGHGVLNAFATRFIGRNYVVLYTSVLAAAYKEGRPAVEFIIGHELGHLKRKHISAFKSIFLLPAKLVPFLGSAYSRACEYTCDSIGYSLCPEGAAQGMLILASGTELYKKVNAEEFISEAQKESDFSSTFAEIISSHPHLYKRIARFPSIPVVDEVPPIHIDPAKLTENTL